ncbi:hypothetical protein E8D34_10805 [Nocardioides sp. GY 10113]|uniref:hypothetical protein n=1 Tax=Nocardioides sp. GY 10113 TaxID=2569761 RepID=UPI0010A764FA|nr:hypothetical protein [Nocardioides sp. GY 10113]TIC86730.1 hypothetical protein E8D34_10805 [Nocardioides sp. GY 10113]
MSDLDSQLVQDGGATSVEAAYAARVPSYDALRARGEGRRARRRASALGLVAATVAGVIGLARVLAGGPVAEPQPAPTPGQDRDVHATAEIEVPYWSRGILHVGDAAIETPLRDIVFASGTTVVGRAGSERSAWYLVRGGELEPLVAADAWVDVTLAPDGAAVALRERVGDGLRRLSLYDVAARAEIGSVDVPVDVQCCDQAGELVVHGVDLRHRVVYTTDKPWVWSPGEPPVAITGAEVGSFLSQPWPGGTMIQGATSFGSAGGVYGTLSDDGVFAAVGETPTDQQGLWSPAGHYFAYDDGGGLRVQHLDGTDEPLPMDDRASSKGGWWRPIAWSGDDRVYVGAPGGQLARCSAVTLACESFDPPVGRVIWTGGWTW